MRTLIAFLSLAFAQLAFAQSPTLTAPASVGVGSPVAIGWQGGASKDDFITIVPSDAPAGRYLDYAYARENPVKLTAPQEPGRYEIRYLGAESPYPTLARAALTVADVQATLKAPASVPAGQEFAVEWAGPNNARDFVGLVKAGAAESTYDGPYEYTSKGQPLKLRAPDEPGDYELRYMLGDSPFRTLGRLRVQVGGTAASITVPVSVAADTPLEIAWQGPNNPQDFITIVPAGTPEKKYDDFVDTAKGNPAKLTAPEKPGDYEVRYLTGQSFATLASAPLKVTPTSATLDAPASAPARSVVAVKWQGPGNELDYVIIVPKGAVNETRGEYAYVARGKELRIATPEKPGEYELRYNTGTQNLTLGSRPITITPGDVPGALRVVASAGAAAAPPALANGTVAVVFDASGSMLQRLDGQRRIDIAKGAITALVRDVLPPSVNFSLRVFGHKEANSCRTDLELAPAPLDRTAAAARIAAVQAMNLAKTPIGESLKLTAADLKGKPGPHVIVLVTDGEETCGGDPAAAIRELRASGADVRVNIVGFAVDELVLRETFAEWARLGNGRYFNARNANELASSLKESVDVPYAVLDARGTTVATGTVNGTAVALPAGTYRVVTQTAPPRTLDNVVVTADKETTAPLP